MVCAPWQRLPGATHHAPLETRDETISFWLLAVGCWLLACLCNPDVVLNIDDTVSSKAAMRIKRMSASDIYWRVWGLVTYLECARCRLHFQCTEFENCRYCPREATFGGGNASSIGAGGGGAVTNSLEAVQGVTSCCNKTVLRFPTQGVMEGCSRQDHVVATKDAVAQATFDDFMAHRAVITQGEQWFGKDNEPNSADAAASTGRNATTGRTPGGVVFTREDASDDDDDDDDDGGGPRATKDGIFALEEAASGMLPATSKKKDARARARAGTTSGRPSTARAGERPSTAKGVRSRKFEKVIEKDPELIAEENLLAVFADRSVASWDCPASQGNSGEAKHGLDLQRADDSTRMKAMMGHLQVMRKGKGEASTSKGADVGATFARIEARERSIEQRQVLKMKQAAELERKMRRTTNRSFAISA